MSEHKSHAYNSNPFRTVMAQLVMLLSNNPISSLTLGLVEAIKGNFMTLTACIYKKVFLKNHCIS
jgi:hypothetical protein